uniref:Uncharacterized protein n=1 Tax=viral metagenome TaxID=1070528 RepID=A0A6M3X6K7_9ZZZZ
MKEVDFVIRSELIAKIGDIRPDAITLYYKGHYVIRNATDLYITVKKAVVESLLE